MPMPIRKDRGKFSFYLELSLKSLPHSQTQKLIFHQKNQSNKFVNRIKSVFAYIFWVWIIKRFVLNSNPAFLENNQYFGLGDYFFGNMTRAFPNRKHSVFDLFRTHDHLLQLTIIYFSGFLLLSVFV